MRVVDNIYIQRIVAECLKHSEQKEVLVVGAGDCATDYHLLQNGFDVVSTDYQKNDIFEKNMQEYSHFLDYHISDIYNLDSFPIDSSEIVLCMEVLEHLTDYRLAFKNLLKLTKKTLIIGVPWRHSFNQPGPPPAGHCNWWDLQESSVYRDIHEFRDMSPSCEFFVEKILTKPDDNITGQAALLVIINKNNDKESV